MSSGVYALIIRLNKDETIRIGKLCKRNFKKGFYVYVGSALNNLEKRIDRHRRKRKKLFWHIDYLLNSKYAKISEVLVIKTNKKMECKLNRIISNMDNARILVKGFGCSDCICKSHLTYFDEINLIKMIKI